PRDTSGWARSAGAGPPPHGRPAPPRAGPRATSSGAPQGRTILGGPRAVVLTAAILTLGTASAHAAPSFSLPVECQLGPVCVVQNYVDRDAGPEARDSRCRFPTADGHKG